MAGPIYHQSLITASNEQMPLTNQTNLSPPKKVATPKNIPSPPQKKKTNIVKHPPWMMVYFLLKTEGISQLAMLVFLLRPAWGKSSRATWSWRKPRSLWGCEWIFQMQLVLVTRIYSITLIGGYYLLWVTYFMRILFPFFDLFLIIGCNTVFKKLT